ncbi:MAG: TRAP transporter large permease subunit [Sulfuritalea sp.]|jgi:TRAP-type mannitol/chloroaromatic compound transport system permease large subunit|nr:TRAP transporter large permease subunit [Sulfuritalea sp.]MBK8761119.1 TRAP transporter large permease subunit [Sulfuritalea sp.]MBK9349787.1 TRAP transporter large permease subunit [Sulfuritalea sp.]
MKIKKDLWFGFSLMAAILLVTAIFMPWGNLSNGHLGLLMLSLVVVAIMLGFPTAFTLMGMGVIFAWFAYRSGNPEIAVRQTLDLMVQRAYAVMSNDVLISIPLFVFMGYLVERANLIAKLFRSLELSLARVPGSLAVATLVTCAIFATATGIVGAVVTLMGLLAFPAMLKSGYDIRLSAGVITAGGCLGILIPPSVMLIVYGATAGVSVVQLYAGAFFPGLMLAGLYILYVVILAKLKPELAPPLSMEERHIDLPPANEKMRNQISHRVVPGLIGALKGSRNLGIGGGEIARQGFIALLPAITLVLFLGFMWHVSTKPEVKVETAGLVEMGGGGADQAAAGEGGVEEPKAEGVAEPEEEAEGVKEPPAEDAGDGVKEPPAEGVKEPPADGGKEPAVAREAVPAQAVAVSPAPTAGDATPGSAGGITAEEQERLPVPTWYWVMLGVSVIAAIGFYAIFTFVRLEIFKMLLSSFFPLAIMILAVLGSIVFGLATPTEAAAIGSAGGFILAAAYKQLNFGVIKESVFLTAKTSAMVCWLFVGSSIFSAAFALLGGQDLVEKWVLSMNLTPLQFMLLSQFIIFILGWPLEWTEIIVIFMPIFIPLLAHFHIDPLFFGLLVALNLQTAFLSPPVAMAAFYLKGVSPPHVTLNQIFAGMLPFMGIQVVALALLYIFPDIGMWLPRVLYGN